MRPLFVAVLLAICLWILWISPLAADGVAILNVDIPPGKWKGIRLKNLPKDAVVAVEVESNCKLAVALVDANTYRHFSDSTRAIFLGLVEKKLSFSVTIPAKGNYYVILDNRPGQQSRTVRIKIRAIRTPSGLKETSNI